MKAPLFVFLSFFLSDNVADDDDDTFCDDDDFLCSTSSLRPRLRADLVLFAADDGTVDDDVVAAVVNNDADTDAIVSCALYCCMYALSLFAVMKRLSS